MPGRDSTPYLASGEEVHAHYLTAARIEQSIYDGIVTDWERERYLERG